MSTTITVAYDRRCWAQFTVKDATEAEIATLSEDSAEAIALAKALDSAGRLEYVSEDRDDAPDYFNADTSSVIEIEDETEEN